MTQCEWVDGSEQVLLLFVYNLHAAAASPCSHRATGPGEAGGARSPSSHCCVLITSFTFILSLHWEGVLSYPSSDRALDTRSYMAGPGALPENTVPATSSCCIRASVSRSLPHTAMRAFVSDGVHDIPRQAVKLLEDEAAVRPAAPEPTFRGEKRFGVGGLEWYWLLSLKSSDSGDGTSVFGIFNGVDISGECSALLDAAMLPLLLRGGGECDVRGRAEKNTAWIHRLWERCGGEEDSGRVQVNRGNPDY